MTQDDDTLNLPRTAGLSLPIRVILVAVGTASLVLGVIGILLPVLPTTPFLLITAACYARASTRLYEWLIGQPALGAIITEWRRSRSLPPGVRTRALLVVVVTFAVSIALVDSTLLRVILVATGIILAAFLYRLPTAPLEPRSVTITATTAQEERR